MMEHIGMYNLVLIILLGSFHIWMWSYIIRHWKFAKEQLIIRMSEDVSLFPTTTYPFIGNTFSDTVNAYAERKISLNEASYLRLHDSMVCLLSHSSYLNKVGLMPIALLTLLFAIVTHTICTLLDTFLDIPSIFNTINSVSMVAMVSYNIYYDRILRKKLFGTTDPLANHEIENATHVFLLTEESQ